MSEVHRRMINSQEAEAVNVAWCQSTLHCSIQPRNLPLQVAKTHLSHPSVLSVQALMRAPPLRRGLQPQPPDGVSCLAPALLASSALLPRSILLATAALLTTRPPSALATLPTLPLCLPSRASLLLLPLPQCADESFRLLLSLPCCTLTCYAAIAFQH